MQNMKLPGLFVGNAIHFSTDIINPTKIQVF